MPRSAKRQVIDSLTGVVARPGAAGAIDTGRIAIGRLGGDSLEVLAADRSPDRDRFGVEPDAALRLTAELAELARARKATTPLGRNAALNLGGGYAVTFATVRGALKSLVDLNPTFFSDVEATNVDGRDLTRERLAEWELPRRRGATRKMIDDKRGAHVLDARSTSEMVQRMVALYVSTAPGRKWRTVPWSALVDYLSELNQEMDFGPLQFVYPIAAGLDPEGVLLVRAREEIGPKAADRLAAWLTSQALHDLADRLARALEERARGCLAPEEVATARARLSTIRRWAYRPQTMPGWACTPGSDGLCVLAGLAEDVSRIERACTLPYDPAWPRERPRSACGAGDYSGLAPMACGDSLAPLPPLGAPYDDEIPF